MQRPNSTSRDREGFAGLSLPYNSSHSPSLRVLSMSDRIIIPSRRLFLGTLGAALFTTRGLFAEELARTPAQTEGPFYPNKLPLDTDNDLLIINDTITPAVGEITHLTGKVLDAKGNPVRNALVEIWQCDAKGVYLHTDDSDRKKDTQDKNFQGFGRFLTGLDRRILLPHDQAGPVPRPRRRTSTSRSSKAGRSCSSRSATSRAIEGTRRTASTAASATASRELRSRSTSPRSRSRRSASWRRSSTSCLE